MRDGSRRLSLRAFGLDIRTDFPLAGVEAGRVTDGPRSLSLDLGTRAEVERGFPAGAPTLGDLRFDDGRLAVSIQEGGDQGYLTYAWDFGHARISADGRAVLTAPLDRPAWIWQRYLTGQIIPLAALLQGLEVFHAAVMGLEGRAIAVAAASGGGKTTVALELALRGMEFMSDDVLLAEPDGDGLLAHPGIGLANLRPGSSELLARLERRGLASPIGEREREVRISVPCAQDPLPLAALFVLRRFADPGGVTVERAHPVDPRLLLAATFNLVVRTPERLTRQLDVCARLERCATVFNLSCGSDVSAEEVAAAISDRAADTVRRA